MTTDIEIREVPAQRILAKRTTCAHKDIGPAFGATIQSVGACLNASGAKMASAPIAVYLQWRESDCDMAVGCQVEGSVALADGCEWLEVPGGPHAFASHFGPYEKLHETHEAVQKWCAGKAKQISGPCWETYPVDPGREPDVTKWQTDVYYPVQR